VLLLPVKKGICIDSDSCGHSIQRLAKFTGDTDQASSKAHSLQVLMKRVDQGTDEEVEIFRAIADPCRLRILKLLREGEFCVCEIMTALDRPQSSTSHHLSILKSAGLIKERREGKWSLYRLSDGAVIELINQSRLLKEVPKTALSLRR